MARLLVLLVALALSGCVQHPSDELATVYDSPAEVKAEVGRVGTMTQELYPAGCEVVSLINALHTFGVDLDFEHAYGCFDKGPGFVETWWGDPYTEGAAYPPAMVTACRRALQGTAIQVRDMTDCSMEDLTGVLDGGGVLIVWTTTDDALPRWTEWEVDGWRMYANEHCAVLHGLEDGVAYVMDPLKGDRRISADVFEEIWTSCGSMAVAIY